MNIHLSNAVVASIEEKRQLHSQYEDRDLEGAEDATNLYEWLEQHAPGQFVLIDTGDYIIAPCGVQDPRNHPHCETYDAAYRLYLVPMSIWNTIKDEVLAADTAWRQEQLRCRKDK